MREQEVKHAAVVVLAVSAGLVSGHASSVSSASSRCCESARNASAKNAGRG